MQIDLFCRVIDNFGDIGVCWRLARQLVAEHACDVRLVVDDLRAFRTIAPTIDPDAPRQTLLGVDIIAWSAADSLTPRDVAVEAFACDPPAAYVTAMASRSPQPVWINLEYLSAEAWVDQVHGMPSQHPRLPLRKYFFCPGFTPVSGGLIREATVKKSETTSAAPRTTRDRQIFAFAYPQAPVIELASGFKRAGIEPQVTLAAPLTASDSHWKTAIPVAQTGFDAVLAQYDLLVVRGEDSFVRAQWAGKPLLWNIYPTADNAHLVKLDAWLDRYCAGLDAGASAAYRAACRAFNLADDTRANVAIYASLAQQLDALSLHATRWRAALLQQTDLATRLMAFVNQHKAEKVG